MKITRIRYRKLVSLPTGYAHQAVELEAEVEPGEDPDDAMAALKAEVDRQLVEGEERHRVHLDIEAMRNDAVFWSRQRDELKIETAKLRESVTKLRHEKRAAGGEPDDDMPF